MVSNFKSEDILFFLWFSVCCDLAGFIEKMKRMKAFVNELMRDASDATRRQKVIGITRSDSILFQFSFSFRERWNAFPRAWKKQKNENNTTLFFIIVVKTKKTTKKTTKKKLMQRRAYLECVEKKEEL